MAFLAPDNRPWLIASALDLPGLTALDRKRAASMADEGGVSAASIEGGVRLAASREVLRD